MLTKITLNKAHGINYMAYCKCLILINVAYSTLEGSSSTFLRNKGGTLSCSE